MIKPSRPTLWLAILLAAGIMLVPHRGAAMMGPNRWYDPPEMIGDPDIPPGGVSKPLHPGDWKVVTVTLGFIHFVIHVPSWMVPVVSRPSTVEK